MNLGGLPQHGLKRTRVSQSVDGQKWTQGALLGSPYGHRRGSQTPGLLSRYLEPLGGTGAGKLEVRIWLHMAGTKGLRLVLKD